VVGRVFWDSAAVFLSQRDGVTPTGVGAMLEELRQHEMIFMREESGFANVAEYVFRHAILRDVTYGTVVPRQRRAYHKLVGDWLLQIGGERAHEHALLVAEHYDLAGEPALAAAEFARAGKRAIELSAIEEAITTLEKARKLLSGEEHAEQLLPVLIQLGEAHGYKGAFREAQEALGDGLSAARATGNRLIETQALAQLGRLGIWEGEPEAALRHLNEALPLSRELGEKSTLVFVLRQVGNLLVGDRPGEARAHLTESLELARELGETEPTASALNSLGNVANAEEDYPTALERYRESLAMFRGFDHKAGVSMALQNMADVQIRLGELATAHRSIDESLAMARETGSDSLIEGALAVKAELLLKEGKNADARVCLDEAIRSARLGGHRLTLIFVLGMEALLRAREGDPREGMAHVSLVLENLPDRSVVTGMRWIQDEIRGMLPSEEADAAAERGRALDLEALLAGVGGGSAPPRPVSPAGS
jgi:tetratricopeptide (TPR) repeat protein